jgi:hypothetical protein
MMMGVRPHVRPTTAFLFCFLQKLWDSGIGLSAWLVRLSVMVVDPASAASVGAGAGAASEAESSPPAVVRELKERLFGRSEECHVIELGATPPAASLLLTVVH